jgi:2-methylcitrate dehydratase PrpD
LAGCRKRRLAKYYVYGEVSAAAVIAVISDINNERIITAIAIIEATNIFELILCFL